MTPHWCLECSACSVASSAESLATVCVLCGQPLLVRYEQLPAFGELADRWDMWRYSALLPLVQGESPVTLGEGCTPLLDVPELARQLGLGRLLVKDESLNPTGSFKARGMSAAVTRARALGVAGLVVPTAGNAGAALAAYARAAGLPARVYAPSTTPAPILATIEALGAELSLVDGHIGDAGREARAFATAHNWFDVSTLREPYRIEGKKTLGVELAEQLGWTLPDVIVYPTGGGTGLIGMWKVFDELLAADWLRPGTRIPRMITAQAAGCAPIVRAFARREGRAQSWPDPETHASGLRVPSPLGDRLILRALRESNGDAGAASEAEIRRWTLALAHASGVDAAPEGGCAVAVLHDLIESQRVSRDGTVVVFNTGAGASYRTAAQ